MVGGCNRCPIVIGRTFTRVVRVALVPLAAVVTIASFDDIVRVDASTWLIANYIMCGIGDGA